MSKSITRSQCATQEKEPSLKSLNAGRKSGTAKHTRDRKQRATRERPNNRKAITSEATTIYQSKVKPEIESPTKLKIETETVKKRILERSLATLERTFLGSAMVCREKEFQEIKASVLQYGKTSSAIYICGAPGTGKTSTILQMIDTLMLDCEEFDYSYVNGVMISSVEQLFEQLMSKSQKKNQGSLKKVVDIYKEEGLLQALNKIARNRKLPMIVILDEADQINDLPWLRSSVLTKAKVANNHESFSQCSSLLEELVRFCIQDGSKFTLVAISNSLALGKELKESLGRTIRSHTNRKTSKTPFPKLFNVVVFKTYTDEELKAILNRRFKLAKDELQRELKKQGFDVDNELRKVIELFEPVDETAIRLLLKKLAAHQGDCRQMLDAVRDLLGRNLAKLASSTVKSIQPNNKRRQCDTNDESSSDVELRESPLKKSRHSSESEEDVSTRSKGRSNSSTAISSLSPSPERNRRHESQAISSSPIVKPINYNNSDDIAELLAIQVQKISLRDTQSVLADYFESPMTRTLQLLSHVPLHQQILLFAVQQSVKENMRRLKETSAQNECYQQYVDCSAIQNCYKLFCSRTKINERYNSVTLIDGLTDIEQHGLIRIHDGSKNRGLMKRPSVPLTRSSSQKRINTRNQSPMVELILESSNVENALSELKLVFKQTLMNDND